MILVSSMAALRAGPMSGTAYGTAKAAARNYMAGLAAELRQKGIRATTIFPGEVPRSGPRLTRYCSTSTLFGKTTLDFPRSRRRSGLRGRISRVRKDGSPPLPKARPKPSTTSS